METLIDEKELYKALSILKSENELFEIRIQKENYTLSGYFKDKDIALKMLKLRGNELAKANTYITLNSVKDACFSRKQKNQFLAVKPTTSDNDIANYSFLFVDIDPERPTGVSSSKEEFKAAAVKANDVYVFLRDLGFKEPITACSGNGYHLLYKINLPNNEDTRTLITQCLNTLSQLFSDDQAKVDTVNSNPARICKLYGTLAQKGANTEERPHRMSKILKFPEHLEENSVDLLKELASQLPEEAFENTVEETGKSKSKFNLEKWLKKYDIKYKEDKWIKGWKRFLLDECPFDATHTDGEAAILLAPNGAISFRCVHNSCQNKKWRDVRLKFEPDAYSKKKKSSGGSKKPAFTIDALKFELNLRKIFIRYNDISNELEISWNDGGFSAEDTVVTLPSLLRSELCDKYAYCNKESIFDYLQYIARENRYNPVLKVLNNNTWDKEDRLEELFEILNLQKDDMLSRKLIVKWIWQGLALLENTREKDIAPQGILVLKGPQGIGKTTLLAELARLTPDCFYFRGGQSIDSYDKDTRRRCLTTWIAELGELDSTFKRSDVGMLKAFITQSYDEYRLPYARNDERIPRRTNLCASVNEDTFLVDPTGNRRYWTVPTNDIDIEAAKKFNSLQLWLQIKEQYYLKNPKGFFLDTVTQAELAKRNNTFEKPIPGELEVQDILYKITDGIYETEEITVTEFMQRHSSVLGKFKAQQIGKVLTKLGYGVKNKRVGGSVIKVRELPRTVISFNSTGHTTFDSIRA